MRNYLFLLFVLFFSFNQFVFAQEIDDVSKNELLTEMQNIRASLDKINEGNTIIFWTSFGIGIGIAVIAITATIHNSRKLNHQIETHEREVRHRIRPILVRDFFEDGNTYSIRDKDPNGKRFWIKIANKGPLPSVKMKRWLRSGIRSDKNTRSFPLDDTDFNYTEMSSLGPGEQIDNTINLSNAEYDELCNGTNYFFELKIEYSEPEEENHPKNVSRTKKYHYHIRGHFKKRTLFQDFIDMN